MSPALDIAAPLQPTESPWWARCAGRAVCGSLGTAYQVGLPAFPPLVRIETTNACNAQCIICPHSRSQRPPARMDDELYAHLIDQCAQGGCREVHLHNFGEPLLDRCLPERVALAKERGIGKVKIFTNGSLLSEERAEALIQAGLDEIKISFDGATADEFERIRTPLKFDTVVSNVRRLVELRNRRGAPLRILVACCSTQDKQSTMRFLEQSVDGFSFGRIHNWSEDESGQPRSRIRKPCSRLWRTMTILSNGAVALCCLDYDGRHLLGHVDSHTPLAAIWQGEAYRRVRRLHRLGRQDEIDLCRGCSKAFV